MKESIQETAPLSFVFLWCHLSQSERLIKCMFSWLPCTGTLRTLRQIAAVVGGGRPGMLSAKASAIAEGSPSATS